jgi:hypothetical protein
MTSCKIVKTDQRNSRIFNDLLIYSLFLNQILTFTLMKICPYNYMVSYFKIFVINKHYIEIDSQSILRTNVNQINATS